MVVNNQLMEVSSKVMVSKLVVPNNNLEDMDNNKLTLNMVKILHNNNMVEEAMVVSSNMVILTVDSSNMVVVEEVMVVSSNLVVVEEDMANLNSLVKNKCHNMAPPHNLNNMDQQDRKIHHQRSKQEKCL